MAMVWYSSLLSFLPIIIVLIIVIVVLVIVTSTNKKKNEMGVSWQYVLEDVTKNTSAEKVFAFMNYFNNSQGFIDNPQNSDKLRGIWFIVNGSANISADVKMQFKNWLLFKGFRLSDNEMQIIDNYGTTKVNDNQI
ncbi:MAG: hypothetical protein IJO09_05125 [Oscillospiraceae bacterium]|nr:hypothetical protein [Oscillospiraceae bacterium]